jgi:hypothetical protein
VYLNSYNWEGFWSVNKINWDEKGKLVLSKPQKNRQVKVRSKDRYLEGKLMSYVLGKSPFYLIRRNSVCFENVPFEKKLEHGEILSARATKDGLILIHKRRDEHFLIKYTHDGKEEKNTPFNGFPSNFTPYARWHSFNQPSRMHSLVDFSTERLPIGYSMLDSEEYIFYYFEGELIHEIKFNREDGKALKLQKDFILNIFSSDKQIRVRGEAKLCKFRVPNANMKTSFWISQTSPAWVSEPKVHSESRD